jgi:hypothetical protein
MAFDATLPVRRAGLTALKADAPLTAEIAETSIHPQVPREAPVWPFVKWGAPAGIPIRASCVDGNEVTVAVHGFSKGRWTGASLIETAEDHAARIGALIASALDAKRLELEDGGWATFRWAGSQLLVDGEDADAFHTVQNFRVRVIA